jgi:hypothetical protein
VAYLLFYVISSRNFLIRARSASLLLENCTDDLLSNFSSRSLGALNSTRIRSLSFLALFTRGFCMDFVIGLSPVFVTN